MTEGQLARAIIEEQFGPVVLVVAPSSDVSRDLCQGLSLHGFQPRLVDQLEALDPAVLAREVSAVVLYDWELEAELPFLALGNDRPPVVCLGQEDTFLERYVLAEKGMDGFFTLPLDLPLLVDFIERLISERDELDRGRVMIVDDDPELLEHYSLVLEEVGLVVCRVNDPSTLLTSLSEFRPNLVLMDMQMGRYSGATLARMIRFDPEWLGLPIVYLSSEENRERQLEALSHGGDDFLTKPVSDHYLQRAVLVRCYRARQLEKLATRDSLTGLLKHSLANAEIENAFARSVRTGQESVVAMLDLDHFKRVNDRYGHSTGDAVLSEVARRLVQQMRSDDTVARLGGDEFVLLFNDVDPARRELVGLHRLQVHVRARNLYQIEPLERDRRRRLRANHSATHLLHEALRHVDALGSDVGARVRDHAAHVVATACATTGCAPTASPRRSSGTARRIPPAPSEDGRRLQDRWAADARSGSPPVGAPVGGPTA